MVQWLGLFDSPAGGTGLVLVPDPTSHKVQPKINKTVYWEGRRKNLVL